MYILAFALVAALATNPPKLVEPHQTREACMIAADKQNHRMGKEAPEIAAKGFEFVCLKVERTSV